MKCIPAISAFAALGFVACDTMNAPISSGDFDPLRPPGSNLVSTSNAGDNSFSPGQFVRAAMDNTAFFSKRPDGDADADKLLKRDTSMKVVSNAGSYVKVELDSGEIGFVPSVMVVDPSAAPDTLAGSPNEVQVYPPLPGSGPIEPLPAFDAAGAPPEGAIPTIIDPEAPSPAPVPGATTPTETFPVPPEPAPATGAPLPPNGEELEGQ